MWLLQYIRIGYEHVFINHVITSITNYIDYYGNYDGSFSSNKDLIYKTSHKIQAPYFIYCKQSS